MVCETVMSDASGVVRSSGVTVLVAVVPPSSPPNKLWDGAAAGATGGFGDDGESLEQA
jgi:hypothetical protein